MTEYLVAATAVLLLIVLVLQILLLRLKGPGIDTSVSARLDSLDRGQERIERAVREEIARNREEGGKQSQALREEVVTTLKGMTDTVLKTLSEMANSQRARLEDFSKQLASLTEANQAAALQLREEVTKGIQGLNESMLKQMSEISTLQKGQLETFAATLAGSSKSSDEKLEAMRQALDTRLGQLQKDSGDRLDGMKQDNASNAKLVRDEMDARLKAFNETMLKGMQTTAEILKAQLDGFSKQLAQLTETNEKKGEALRLTVEQKLASIQEENSKKLEEMRKTVNEQLQGTLEKRLGEAFTQVSERLEQVHKGLGEMQNLASGVGDLKKVLTNVKTRGTWGEIQLGNLLEQVLTPEQYATNVATREGSGERVEFAIKLPGREDMGGKEVWLPIDAKFPTEDYQRLVDAADRADAAALESAGRQLEVRIKGSAQDIHDKYLNPPATTDFGIMYLPSEGLYAEVLRRAGLVESLQREFRVVVAGPTTLAALLNSLQMGFRTLAIQKRSSEVWAVLGAVKTEFGKFKQILEKVQAKLQEASKVIDQAGVRTRAITRKLRDVQELPAPDAHRLLGPTEAAAAEPHPELEEEPPASTTES